MLFSDVNGTFVIMAREGTTVLYQKPTNKDKEGESCRPRIQSVILTRQTIQLKLAIIQPTIAELICF